MPDVGTSDFIDPTNICVAFVSPRQRAQKTFDLLFEHLGQKPKHVVTEEAREWDYGGMEGLTPAEILARYPGWNIYTHG